MLDLDREEDREKLRSLLAQADVLLEFDPKGTLEAIGLGKDALASRYPTLIHARVTPFGDEGPGATTRAATSFIWRSAA